jgi:hypothetical protein
VALWQFVTFTLLIGALLVCLSVIIRRLGCADARLNRIEEALLAKFRSIDSTDTRAADAKPEVSAGQEGGGDYLTMRDLRQLSSRTTRSGSSGSTIAVSERRDFVLPSSEIRDASPTGGGRPSPLSYDPPSDDSVAKKNRDMMLFLSNQRRRRRARLGY